MPPLSPVLEVKRLTKQFPGVLALHRVSLQLHSGEVLAVIGENGAGKSTLAKILAGVQQPDHGEVRLDGERVRIDSVRVALQLGIALIHQELNLADNLDVATNLFLGREQARFGWIRRRRLYREAQPYLDRVGLKCAPWTPVSDLSLGQQQMVEIAKALSAKARVLIMDEPTSSLSQHETQRLFGVIRSLRNQGVSVIYISHRLREVKELADRVVVLRDGKNAGHLGRNEIDHDRMVKLMVGRDLSPVYGRGARPPGRPVLETIDIRTPAFPRHKLTLTVRVGEMVGVAGLVGAGRTEMLRVLFGIDPPLGGTIRVQGREVRIGSPVDAIRAGMALVPEDRQLQGLILEMAVGENLSLASLRRDARMGFRQGAKESAIAERMIRQLRIRTPGPNQVAQFLSGGNQQKIVLGKWLALQPRVLLMDEPTRGVDVGAKQEIYRLMEELVAHGIGILFVSSEMEEILRLSDRTVVMHEGRIAGELGREELSEEGVMQLAAGLGRP